MTPEGDVRTIEPGTPRPRYCVWELTLACNLRCGHCGSRAGKARPDEMDTDECRVAIRSLAALGCEVITLSGGEPTLRPDWDELACEIRQCGMIPNMVTNGFALDESQARRMKASGLANVAVSIDGPADVHDSIRGLGAFERTRRALLTLRDTGVSTTVMTTVNTLNLTRLEEVHALAVELGADRWRCQLGKPMGHMQTNSDMVVKPADLLTLLPVLYRLDQGGPIRVGIGDSIGYYGPYDSGLRSVSWKGQPQRWAGCQAGLQAIGIESDGGIKGCLSMQAFSGQDDPFLEGNLRQRSLEAIWFDPDGFAYNRKFSPDDLTGFCAGCKYRLICRGGARCVAAAVRGALGEDPYCYHRVAALATRWPGRLLKRQIATAASVVSLMCAGCLNYGSVGDQGEDPITCEEVCCECDSDEYPPGIWEECCEPVVVTEYGVEPPACEDVCCECEYGELPPGVREECCEPVVTPDYGDVPPDCENVCCDCDYGELPPGVWEECCQTEPIDCQGIDCDSDYGVLPPDVVEACCGDDEEP